ncbi:unnamed protein product [Spodoptera littoralis]|uniref:Uncharacterized protein n=1 Tax=Spodoptera littoralis TaxID=7109 RepID=A0A9P0N9S3_SPOLI|nr:unnamed protein product [Spodoptera littoralis]CAH1647591.1 unnamed protein product [Spodoptera littoralis]
MNHIKRINSYTYIT